MFVFLCFVILFPTPAVRKTELNELKHQPNGDSASRSSANISTADNASSDKQIKPGTLPESAGEISNAARSLLKRLLEPEPSVRLKSIRQLQQTAFYMGFNFEHGKAKKVSPKTILERYVPSTEPRTADEPRNEEFACFEQFEIPL